MPGGDKTGPMGQGSQTGRGLGDCPPSTEKKRSFFGFGGGFGRGRGGGRGRGRGFGFRRMWPWKNSSETKDDKQE